MQRANNSQDFLRLRLRQSRRGVYKPFQIRLCSVYKRHPGVSHPVSSAAVAPAEQSRAQLLGSPLSLPGEAAEAFA